MKYFIVIDNTYYELPSYDLILVAIPNIKNYTVEHGNNLILDTNNYPEEDIFFILKRLDIVLGELLPTLTEVEAESVTKLKAILKEKLKSPKKKNNFFINNELRDLVYKNNLQHGFWDNRRSYEEFIRNVMGEFDETLEELHSGRKPTDVYFTKGTKREGAPTELADIIIFILDYFGGSEPQIDVDENFLTTPNNQYKNTAYYEQMRNIEPWQYFIYIRDEGRNIIAASEISHLLHGNEIYEQDGEKRGVPIELHSIIKLVLLACDIYAIDIEQELIAKINYNNSRPKDYRKMGESALLETDRDAVYSMLIDGGYGAYKELDEVIAERMVENELIMKKRADRKLSEENDQLSETNPLPIKR